MSDWLSIARDAVVVFSFLSGVAFWWDRHRNRPRLIIHLLEESTRPDQRWGISFEIENLGARLTSLQPVIHASAISMIGEDVSATLRLLDNQNRTLEPHKPVRLNAVIERGIRHDATTDDPLSLTSYRAYQVRAMRGRAAVFRMAAGKSGGQGLRGWWMYLIGRRKARRKGRERWKQIQREANGFRR